MASKKVSCLSGFISKAETLKKMSELLTESSIEQIYEFSQSEWQDNKYKMISNIKNEFDGKTIIVRSSALGEDCVECSNAGVFKSILNVDSTDKHEVEKAVNEVIKSYKDKGFNNPSNQILIQAQTMDAILSGTVLARDYNGAPYYVINFSGEDTTSVTSGRCSQSIKVLKNSNIETNDKFSNLLVAVQEIENLFPDGLPLDIEFGIKKSGKIVIFQVRPLVASKKSTFSDTEVFNRVKELKITFKRLIKRRSHLAGNVTYFGDMPDWNPAEIIGNSPHLLAVSLYDEIITNKVWYQARKSQGYVDVSPAKLVVQFGNKPYVDVRNSFNSFIPVSVPFDLREKLLAYYLVKLKEKPCLQDKVEFDILFTCYDLSFKKRSEELLIMGFSQTEINLLRKSLLTLTNQLLCVNKISEDIKDNIDLERYRQSLPKLGMSDLPSKHIERALCLLGACKEKGTLQFSRLARLGFIGKIILKSLVSEGILNAENCNLFLESIVTVATEFSNDIDLLGLGKIDLEKFTNKYGHLRPGTYDITLPRYSMSKDYFNLPCKRACKLTNKKSKFEIDAINHNIISKILDSHGLTISSGKLFKFIKLALEAREYSKFLFTKSLSDAIEEIAFAGDLLGFSREELSYLDIKSIKLGRGQSSKKIIKNWKRIIVKNKRNYELNCCLSLPPVLFSENDFDIVSHYSSQPNYITNKRVAGEVLLLDGTSQVNLTGKIVLVESADPGFDWIFAKKPMALVTKYGGPASHMSIRCAELGLPAVIGAGSILYESISNKSCVVLDCQNQQLKYNGGVP